MKVKNVCEGFQIKSIYLTITSLPNTYIRFRFINISQNMVCPSKSLQLRSNLPFQFIYNPTKSDIRDYLAKTSPKFFKSKWHIRTNGINGLWTGALLLANAPGLTIHLLRLPPSPAKPYTCLFSVRILVSFLMTEKKIQQIKKNGWQLS